MQRCGDVFYNFTNTSARWVMHFSQVQSWNLNRFRCNIPSDYDAYWYGRVGDLNSILLSCFVGEIVEISSPRSCGMNMERNACEGEISYLDEQTKLKANAPLPEGEHLRHFCIYFLVQIPSIHSVLRRQTESISIPQTSPSFFFSRHFLSSGRPKHL